MKKMYTPRQKAAIALSALRGEQLSKLASLHGIHPNQIGIWKKAIEQGAETLFSDKRKKEYRTQERIIEALYKTIGQREVEISWLKKNFISSCPGKSSLIDRNHETLSLSRQAELLGLSRSSLYHEPKVSEMNLLALRAIDEIYTRYPFYGARRMREALLHDYGLSLCREHIGRLMRVLGIEAIYPKRKPDTSQGNREHKIYPYLLRNIDICTPNQVWGTDITYIRLKGSFAYLMAILD